MSLVLDRIKRTDPRLLANMKDHYSKPLGFVGRNLCYAIIFDGISGCLPAQLNDVKAA